MRKTIFTLSILAVAFASCKKEGCMDENAVNYDAEAKKEGVCNYIPTITVNGANPDTVEFGTTYTDAGATAANVDGSAVTVTTDASAVNTDSLGTYTVSYSATNDHGTVTAERTVVVIAGQANFLGSWTCSNQCDQFQFPLAADPTVSAGITSSDIVIDNFFTFVGGTVNATIDGLNITVPEQTISIQLGDIILVGSGTMNESLNQMTITYDYENTAPFVGGTGSCTATYDK